MYRDPPHMNLPYLNESEKRKVRQEVKSMLMGHVGLVEARNLKESNKLTSEEAYIESLLP